MNKDTRLIFEAYQGKQQSLPVGTKVIFSLKDNGLDDFCFDEEDEVSPELIKHYDGQEATIEAIEDTSVLGETDYEYYDIIFDNLFRMQGVSGYYLDPVSQ